MIYKRDLKRNKKDRIFTSEHKDKLPKEAYNPSGRPALRKLTTIKYQKALIEDSKSYKKRETLFIRKLVDKLGGDL